MYKLTATYDKYQYISYALVRADGAVVSWVDAGASSTEQSLTSAGACVTGLQRLNAGLLQVSVVLRSVAGDRLFWRVGRVGLTGGGLLSMGEKSDAQDRHCEQCGEEQRGCEHHPESNLPVLAVEI